MNRFLRSSAFRLSLGYVAVSMAVLVLFAAPLWYAWRQNVEQVRTELLREDMHSLKDIFEDQGPGVLAAVIKARADRGNLGTELTLFTGPGHKRLAGNLGAWPQGMPASPGVHTLTVSQAGRPIRVLLARSRLSGGYELFVGRDDARFKPLETLFVYGLAGATGILLIAGVVGGMLIRRELLTGVNRIRQTTVAIVDGDFSRRLQVEGASHELDLLAQTVNRMLAQIDQLVHGVRNVSNAIAHDLRTPLAELRSRLEVLALTRPEREETFAEIDAAVADVDRVIAIFNALLRLAELDTGARLAGFVPVEVGKVANDVAEFYQPVADLKDVALSTECSCAATLSGDGLLIAQALSNLVDNALKYAPKDGAISIGVGQRADGVIEISVADDGPGISDAEKPKVTERFYRGDTSRGAPGMGLGLSLVAAVARLHGGSLVLSDNHPGLRATLILGSTAMAAPASPPVRSAKQRARGIQAVWAIIGLRRWRCRWRTAHSLTARHSRG